jgi:hypothetical protein
MKKKVMIASFFIFLALITTVSLWLYEAKYFVGRASTIEQDFSPDNSYVFVTPLRATANGQEQIRATVFILNNQGLGVRGRSIKLTNAPNITIQTIQGATDTYGKAVFDISSNQKGEYFLDVIVSDKKLPQQVHLSFY